jgi:hypothetical protein
MACGINGSVVAMDEGEREQQAVSPLNECEMSEAEIDLNLEDTFPASDAPSWTLGAKHCEDSPNESSEGKSRPEDISQEDEA